MDANEKIIDTFATRVRQMILQYHDVVKENGELYAMVDERDAEIRRLQAEVRQLQNDYNSLKTARMLEVSDTDLDTAKRKVNKLIRDVDKCITLLSEQQQQVVMAEADQNKINIRLHIYDTDIMVRVPRDEEPLYRKDAELINELLNAYFSNFKGMKGDKEITYFAMIDLGLRLQKELKRNDTKPYDDILTKLTSEIEAVLKEK